jgi:hypothetical protein
MLSRIGTVEGEEVADLAAIHIDDRDPLAGVYVDRHPGTGRYWDALHPGMLAQPYVGTVAGVLRADGVPSPR